jgi:hypothetical protein
MNAIDHFTKWLETASPTNLMRLLTMRVVPPSMASTWDIVAAHFTTRELRKLVQAELQRRRDLPEEHSAA